MDVAERPLHEIDGRLVRTSLLLRVAEANDSLAAAEDLAGLAKRNGYTIRIPHTGVYPAFEGTGPLGTVRFGSLAIYVADETRQTTDAAIVARFEKKTRDEDPFRFLVAEYEPPAR